MGPDGSEERCSRWAHKHLTSLHGGKSGSRGTEHHASPGKKAQQPREGDAAQKHRCFWRTHEHEGERRRSHPRVPGITHCELRQGLMLGVGGLSCFQSRPSPPLPHGPVSSTPTCCPQPCDCCSSSCQSCLDHANPKFCVEMKEITPLGWSFSRLSDDPR